MNIWSWIRFTSLCSFFFLFTSLPVHADGEEATGEEKTSEKKKAGFEIYGFAQADAIQDFGRVDPNWETTLRPSKIGVPDGSFGSNIQNVLSPRQSRFGAKGHFPVSSNGEEEVYTQFEFDLFGVGMNAGQSSLRLRHAYGQWNGWLAGQTYSLFMDPDVFPDVIDYWGPSGMAYFRTTQIRWTLLQDSDLFSIAIEQPFETIDSEDNINRRYLDPSLAANLQQDEKIPDVTARFRFNRPWGHLQVAAILRRLGYDAAGTIDNAPNDRIPGWGINVSSALKLGEQETLMIAALYGQGIASYMNDGGVDLAAQGEPGNLSARAVPLYGVLLYYNQLWTEQWSSAWGYSRTQVVNTNIQAPITFHSGEYASANLLYKPVKEVLMGGEFLWGRLTQKSGESNHDLRAQISFRYSFSSANL